MLQLHRIVHHALNQATRWGLVARNVAALVARNVAALVDAPRRNRHTVRPLMPEEARKLLAEAQGDRLEALYVLALMTGMRKGELLGLQWADVNLKKGELVVTHTLSLIHGRHYDIGPTKTLSSRRSILLASAVVDSLRAHQKRQQQDRVDSLGAWQESGLVFTNIIGQPLDPTNVLRRSFYPLLEKAGLPRMRFHDLRHTAASLLLGEGIHPKIVSEMLGHAQIAITLDLYSHVSSTMLGPARDAFDGIFGCQDGCQNDQEGSDDAAPTSL